MRTCHPLAVVACAFACLLSAEPAKLPVPADTGYQSETEVVWRPRVPAGEWCYRWGVAGAPALEPVAALIDAAGRRWPTGPIPGEIAQGFAPAVTVLGPTGRECWDESQYHHGWQVPANTPPGVYSVVGAQGNTLAFRIEVLPARPLVLTITLAAGAAAEAVEKALATGDVRLSPGLYDWPRALRLPANRTLSGVGAVIRRRPQPTDDAVRATFIPAAGVVIEDLTFQGQSHLFRSGAGDTPHITLRRCTVDGGGLGQFDQSALLVERCRFRQAGLAPLGGSMLVYGCTFEGSMAPAGHPIHVWGSEGLAVVDCVWDRTDRGIDFAPLWGPIRRCLVSDCLFRDMVQGNAGGEIIAFEQTRAGGVERCRFRHCFFNNCAGDAVVGWDAAVKGCEFFHLRCQGFSGIRLDGWEGAEQSGNTFSSVHLTGGRLLFGETATGNTVTDSIIEPARNSFQNNAGWRSDIQRWTATIEARGPNAATNRVTGGMIGQGVQTAGVTVERAK